MFCKYEVIGSSPIVSIRIQIGTLDRNPADPPPGSPGDIRADKELPALTGKLTRRFIRMKTNRFIRMKTNRFIKPANPFFIMKAFMMMKTARRLWPELPGQACCLRARTPSCGIHWNQTHTARRREFWYQDQRACTTSRPNFSFHSRRMMKTASYRPLLFFGHESRNACWWRPPFCLPAWRPRNCHEYREQTRKSNRI